MASRQTVEAVIPELEIDSRVDCSAVSKMSEEFV
jgi:hypothetical protein